MKTSANAVMWGALALGLLPTSAQAQSDGESLVQDFDFGAEVLGQIETAIDGLPLLGDPSAAFRVPRDDPRARSLDFERSDALSASIESAVKGAFIVRHPEAAANAETLFRNRGLIRYFDDFVGGYGYSGTNLADVATAYHILLWEVVNGEEFPLEHASALNEQLRGHLLANAQLATGAEALKQAWAEAAVYEAVLSSQLQNALRDEGGGRYLTALRDEVHRSIASRGLDLRNLVPTAEGFVATQLADEVTAPSGTQGPVEQPSLPAPVSGVGQDAFAGIYLFTVYGYGVGGGVSVRHQPYVFFGNGWAHKGVDGPPAEIDPERRVGDEWLRWRVEGDEYVLTEAGGEERRYGSGRVYKTFPAGVGESLQGTWRALSGGGNTALGGNAMIYAASAIEFMADGRFELRESSGGSNAEAGWRTTAGARRASSGRYHLSGHTIELTFEDGRKEVHGFYFFPNHGEKDTKALGLGGVTYSRRTGS